MKRIKISATTKYMSFLALIDSGVLLIGGISLWINTINYSSLLTVSIVSCKLIPFLFYSLADYSVVIIVLMTFERFYGVWRPFQSNKMNNNNKNLIISCLFCCLINCHFLFTHSLVFDDHHNHHLASNETTKMTTIIEQHNTNFICEYIMWKDFYEKYWIFIDSSIYSFIPSFLIFILNILIISLLNNASKVNSRLSYSNNSTTITTTTTTTSNKRLSERINLISSTTFDSNNNNNRKQINNNFKLLSFQNLKHHRNSRIMSTRIIVMLITINISFCLFSMPMVFKFIFI
jgi:hypothetical protein